MFHGFGNCEDLVTGASETGDISKQSMFLACLVWCSGFGFFLIWAELVCETNGGSIFRWTMHIVGTSMNEVTFHSEAQFCDSSATFLFPVTFF